MKLAYHGFEPLSREQRMSIYNDTGGVAGVWRLAVGMSYAADVLGFKWLSN